MKQDVGELLKAMLWRSRWLIVALMLLGLVMANVVSQYRGARYEASAQVLVSPVDLSTALLGGQVQFVDPQRQIDTERTLASSSELYARVAAKNADLGTPAELQASVSVGGSSDSDIITFTAEAGGPARAVAIANAAAREFVPWRASVSGRALDDAETQIRAQIAEEGASTTLTDQLNRLRVLKTLNGGNATVVEPATEAEKVRPAPVRDSIMGLSIGLIVALLVVAVREALDTTVRSEGDVEDILGVPVLASIPALPRRARLVTFGRHEHSLGVPYALLASDLDHLRADGRSTTLAITSATDNEGKSITSANLAVELARRGSSVVLADLDLRSPSIAGIFEIPASSPGISGGGPVGDLMWRIPLRQFPPRPEPTHRSMALAMTESAVAIGGADRAEDGSLMVVPAGRVPEGNMLARRGTEALDGLAGTAEWIVVDTSPALRAPEMSELARHVDQIIVVVRQGRVTRRELRAFARQAGRWPTRPVGAVLTGVPGREGPYGRPYGSAR